MERYRNSSNHGEHTTNSFKCKVKTTISHLNKHLLYWHVMVGGIHELRRSELLSYIAQ